MKVSVIIPTYKPGAYIWECLESLVRQTFPKNDFEVILVLNGCGEPFKGQIEAFISSKMRGMNVVFIQTDTPGVSNARNMALDVAKGDFVTFIDDDDYVSAEFLEGLYESADEDTVSLCYPYAFYDGKPDVQLKYGITEAYELCVKHGCRGLSSTDRKFFSGPCMKLINMSFIHGRRFDVHFRNGEDSLFMFLISDKIKKLALAPRTAVYYRRYRRDSAVTRKRSCLDRIINAMRIIREYVKIYVKAYREYNLNFFITRILATVKGVFLFD